jgi:hypothetical protein
MHRQVPTTLRRSRRRAVRWLVSTLAIALAAVALVSCGKGAEGPKGADLDGDLLALLPGAVVYAGELDTRALFDHSALGPRLAAIGDRLLPLGDEAGFRASRDVDRVAFAGYATTGADIAVIVRGHFDPAKIDAATTTRTSAPIVKAPYAGRTTYTIGAASYAVLTDKTVVVGTVDGVRRVLERIQNGKLERSLPPWVTETLETPGAQVAIAGDFESQPVAAVAVGSLRLPWLQGLRMGRGIGNFASPGMNFASTLTYGVPQQAEAAAGGVRSLEGWLKVLGPLLGGIRLQNLQVDAQGSDLQCKFALDDEGLGGLLALASRLLPAYSSSPSSASSPPTGSPPHAIP